MERIETTILRNLVFDEDYARKVIPFIQPDFFEVSTEKTIFQEIVHFIVKYNSNITLEALQIEIENSEKQMFLKKSDVVKILETFSSNYDSINYKEINITLLEELLRDQPQILQAEVFSTWKGLLKINVTQKKAKARMGKNDYSVHV